MRLEKRATSTPQIKQGRCSRHADFPHPKGISKTPTAPEDLYKLRLHHSPLCAYIRGSTFSRYVSHYADEVAKQPTTEVFIDFEGNKNKPPTFLGVLQRGVDGETFHQYILEELFVGLAPSERHPQLRAASLTDVLEDIDKRHGKNTPIYAWSSREQTAIDELLSDTELSAQWANRIIDAKQLAKRWARTTFPDHQFKKTEFRGRHTLDQYLDLIEYNVPTVQGTGKTGDRLKLIRETLIKGQSFESWSPGKKKHWTNLLAHNRHDCYGMMAIVDRITQS